MNKLLAIDDTTEIMIALERSSINETKQEKKTKTKKNDITVSMNSSSDSALELFEIVKGSNDVTRELKKAKIVGINNDSAGKRYSKSNRISKHNVCSSSSMQVKRRLFEDLFDKKKKKKNGGDMMLSSGSFLDATPKTLKGGFVSLNVSNNNNNNRNSTSTRRQQHNPPAPQRIMDGSQHDTGKMQGYITSATALLTDKSQEKTIRAVVSRIDQAQGFPVTRRLSLRNNELVGNMIRVVRNDPRITSFTVTPKSLMTMSITLLEQFLGSLRINLHVKSLTFRGVELGNDYLHLLGASMESNLKIEELDLSRNLFTNDAGLADFCQLLVGTNNSCVTLNLENQTTPISRASEDDVIIEAFEHNTSLIEVKLDFQSEEAATKLNAIMTRNRRMNNNDPLINKKNIDKRLINVLSYEAERAEELRNDNDNNNNNLGVSYHHVLDNDWDHLYKLS